MLKYKVFNLLEVFETNTYLVWDDTSKEAILIDPAAPSDDLKNEINNMGLHLKHIFNTHGHSDHIGGNEDFQREFGCPLAIHEYDAEMLVNSSKNLSELMNFPFVSPPATIVLQDSYQIRLGEYEAMIIHTPGHTRGGIVIYLKPYLFSGDTIFCLSVGRTDLPGGNTKQLIQSIQLKIFTLLEDTIILPGHGPTSTVGKEKRENPYV